MLILLIVGAAWLAVLLPPLFRSRIDARPVSSVSDFRRQLYTLQRTQAPMRAQAPLRAMSRPLAPTPAHLRPIMRPGHAPQRPSDSPEIAYMSPGAIIRRRRTNVLYALIGCNGVSLFLAFTTGSSSMIWFLRWQLCHLWVIATCWCRSVLQPRCVVIKTLAAIAQRNLPKEFSAK